MTTIRELRNEARVTQAILARKAGSSQPAIAAYEAGTKSPTLRTVERLAAAVGLDVIVRFVPAMRREELRSLAFHRAVAERLKDDPQAILQRARRHLEQLSTLHPHASRLLDRWAAWLAMPIDDLIARMTDPGTFEREMRQVSPFAGVLDAHERALVINRFRREQLPE